mmetsp:Transcript_23048/g.25411  ORF Transcript_23048/g.25411 Transcript_23048/m.25411 type:complete len:517 (-) Transcript_23048:27-1577(-)
MPLPMTKKTKMPRVALISFGSYRLRVNRPEADMDLLALCPSHCSRTAFFASLVKILKGDNRVKEVHAIATAYTPVIKFVFNGIAIDLLFARLSNDTKLWEHKKGETFLIEDPDLRDLDEAGVRSLNGARVAQLLMSSAPNLEAFRTTLIAVKEWANMHGLYSNVLGFLGGINYALLVACICKRNRKAKPATLLKAFFQTYSRWTWPMPVTLSHITYSPPEGVLPLPVWDSKSNPRDRMHVMPILTPTYPSMNSAYNVGRPQLRRLNSAFYNAFRIVAEIEKGTKSWRDLFEGNEFFKRHSYFLQVRITASNASSYREWFRFVESRLRLLIAGLDSHHHGVQAEPFCRFYDRTYNSNGVCTGFGKSEPHCKTESLFYIALRFGSNIHKADLSYGVSEFLHKVNNWIGRGVDKDLGIEILRHSQLPKVLLKKFIMKHDIHMSQETFFYTKRRYEENLNEESPVLVKDAIDEAKEELTKEIEVQTKDQSTHLPSGSWAMKVLGTNVLKVSISPAKRPRT